jgi:type IV pilus assembly protein PilF
VPEQVTAQSLWLAARIERRMGNFDVLQEVGRQLRERRPSRLM